MTTGTVRMWFDPRWEEDGAALLGRFRRQARLQGWTTEEVDGFVYEAAVNGYDHLVRELEFWVVPTPPRTEFTGPDTTPVLGRFPSPFEGSSGSVRRTRSR
ncbi:MAG: hypothetical protein K2X87_04865 [Gemmataceae bacterium]|nr:hypothetical protein [Gemmataceae bacterium]